MTRANAAAALLALAGARAPQDPAPEPARHALRLSLGPGVGWTSAGEWVLDVEIRGERKVAIEVRGEKTEEEASGEEHERREARARTRFECLEAEGEEIRAVRVTFEESRQRTLHERDGETLRKDGSSRAQPYEEAEVTLRWGEEENEVRSRGGNLETKEREAFERTFRHTDLRPLVSYVLPRDPVTVGEAWTIEGNGVRQVLQHTLGDRLDYERWRKQAVRSRDAESEIDGVLEARLREIEARDGCALATIVVSGRPREEGSAERPDGGASWSADYVLKATIVFDLGRGVPRSLEIEAEAKRRIRASGERETEEGSLSWSQEETVVARYESRFTVEPLESERPPERDAGARARDG